MPLWIGGGFSIRVKLWAQFGHIRKIVLLETRPCVSAKDRKSSELSSEFFALLGQKIIFEDF